MPNPMDAMCWVSPADEKGNIDNLLTRVSRLEEIIALLTGMDISALQLADITSKAGILEDMAATASNAAGGWTTDGTFTGVALSTLGWKMSDGNEFPIVTMLDGVLQFGFGKDGQVSGTKADQWDAAYQSSLANGVQDYGTRTETASSFSGISSSTVTNNATTTSFIFDVTRSGVYVCSTYFTKPYSGTANTRYSANHQINTITPGNPFPGTFTSFTCYTDAAGAGTIGGSACSAGRIDVNIENSIMFLVSDAGTGTTACSGYGMSLVRISD